MYFVSACALTPAAIIMLANVWRGLVQRDGVETGPPTPRGARGHGVGIEGVAATVPSDDEIAFRLELVLDENVS